MKIRFGTSFIEVPNTIVIIIGILWTAGLCAGIYQESKKDNALKDRESFQQIQTNFENEFKQIEKPRQTAVNDFKRGGKIGVGIDVTTRYRTEISQEEFQNSFKQQLEKLGWKFYGEDNSPDYGGKRMKFCRGKFDATLSLETRTIWDDGADYYRLEFSFGFRDSILNNEKLPASCY